MSGGRSSYPVARIDGTLGIGTRVLEVIAERSEINLVLSYVVRAEKDRQLVAECPF
jgi:hypothetical protein